MILEHKRDFSPASIAQATTANRQRTSAYISRRADLRGKIAFTFAKKQEDPCDKCFTLYKKGGVWQLGVHIADVAEFVCPESPLDRDAYARTCALNTPFFSSPMLPKTLITDSCNLSENVDRLTLSVLLDINEQGKLLSVSIDESVVRVAKQCIYSETDALFLSSDPSGVMALREKYAQLAPVLTEMYELGGMLRHNRIQRGGISIDSYEREYIYGRDGKIEEMTVTAISDTAAMVEEFVRFASAAVGKYMSQNGIPCIFVGKSAPKKQELEFLGNIYGITCDKNTKDEAYLSSILESASIELSYPMICELAESMMPPPVFSQMPVNDVYTAYDQVVSFVNPTERYCDLLVQQLVKESLLAKKQQKSDMRRFLLKVDAFAAMANLVARTAEGFLASTKRDYFAEIHEKHAEPFDCMVVLRHGELRAVLSGGILARFCPASNPTVAPEGMLLAGAAVRSGELIKARYVETDGDGNCIVAPVVDVSRETSEESHF